MLFVFILGFHWRWLGKLAMVLMLAAPTAGSATVIRMQTSLGVIDVRLYDKATLLTVANFLKYAKSGVYTGSFIHRSVPGFIIQGGGFTWGTPVKSVTTNPPVKNEFSVTRSNLRGTIAMAKLGTDPNSATSQWFFNLADNSANLDKQNGGFTVFGKVLTKGMGVADAIADLPRTNAGGAFTDLPYSPPVTNNTLQKSNMVIINTVSVGAPASTTASNRVFSYLESLYPSRFSPANSLVPASGVSKTGSGYYYRYYSKTKRYVATANGKVYWGSALGNTLTPIGTLTDWLAKAAKLGY
ncbi:MAG: peptidylprolyl isomerase [Methylococcaceae bacterium]